MGLEEEQTQDELRETQQRSPLLLRQEHHPQGTRKEIRVPICVRSRVHARHVVQRAPASVEGRNTRVCETDQNRETTSLPNGYVPSITKLWCRATKSPHQLLSLARALALLCFPHSLRLTAALRRFHATRL